MSSGASVLLCVVCCVIVLGLGGGGGGGGDVLTDCGRLCLVARVWLDVTVIVMSWGL